MGYSSALKMKAILQCDNVDEPRGLSVKDFL